MVAEQCFNDEHGRSPKTWLQARLRATTMREPGWRFRVKLDNHLTLVNEKYATHLQDAESQPAANVPAATDDASALIRALGHTPYAWSATLTTGRSLRLAQRVPNRNVEGWRQLVAEKAPKTAGRRFAMLQAVLQPGMGDTPATFEETWKN